MFRKLWSENLFFYFVRNLTRHTPYRPKPAVISRTITLASRSGPASPRRDFFVPYCSHCFQKGLTNQNPLTAHIFIGLRGGLDKKAFCLRKAVSNFSFCCLVGRAAKFLVIVKNSSRPPTVGRLLANRLPTGYQQITDSLPTDYRQLTNRLPTVGNLKKQGEKTLRNLAINLSSLYILTKLKREATLALHLQEHFPFLNRPIIHCKLACYSMSCMSTFC